MTIKHVPGPVHIPVHVWWSNLCHFFTIYFSTSNKSSCLNQTNCPRKRLIWDHICFKIYLLLFVLGNRMTKRGIGCNSHCGANMSCTVCISIPCTGSTAGSGRKGIGDLLPWYTWFGNLICCHWYAHCKSGNHPTSANTCLKKVNALTTMK